MGESLSDILKFGLDHIVQSEDRYGKGWAPRID